jgi:hypothetical protein
METQSGSGLQSVKNNREQCALVEYLTLSITWSTGWTLQGDLFQSSEQLWRGAVWAVAVDVPAEPAGTAKDRIGCESKV